MHINSTHLDTCLHVEENEFSNIYFPICVSFTLDHYIVGLKINYSYEACVR